MLYTLYCMNDQEPKLASLETKFEIKHNWQKKKKEIIEMIPRDFLQQVHRHTDRHGQTSCRENLHYKKSSGTSRWTLGTL